MEFGLYVDFQLCPVYRECPVRACVAACRQHILRSGKVRRAHSGKKWLPPGLTIFVAPRKWLSGS